MNGLAEVQALYQGQVDEKTASLKDQLKELALNLRELMNEKKQKEYEAKKIEEKINEVKTQIYHVWGPHIAGAEYAELDCDGAVLTAEETLNVTTEIKEDAIDWLTENGYKDVMKWDIHTQTLKKIARDLYKEKAFCIPGLEIKTFNVIKAK